MKCPDKYRPKNAAEVAEVEDVNLTWGHAVKLINIYLDKVFADAKFVYGDDDDEGWTEEKYPGETHQAILLDIQPIKKPCEHEATLIITGWKSILTCKKCDLPLKPKDGWVKA